MTSPKRGVDAVLASFGGGGGFCVVVVHSFVLIGRTIPPGLTPRRGGWGACGNAVAKWRLSLKNVGPWGASLLEKRAEVCEGTEEIVTSKVIQLLFELGLWGGKKQNGRKVLELLLKNGEWFVYLWPT